MVWKIGGTKAFEKPDQIRKTKRLVEQLTALETLTAKGNGSKSIDLSDLRTVKPLM